MKYQPYNILNKVLFCLIFLFLGLMSATLTHAETYTFVAKWGSYGSGDGQFQTPIGIAVDSSDKVYVTDWYNHRIQRFDSNGNFIIKWEYSDGSFTRGLRSPHGIDVDSSGNMYVANTLENSIYKFDSSGAFIKALGGDGIIEGSLNLPEDIAVDSSGYVYVADTHNARIQKFDNNGNFITKWGSRGIDDVQFNTPYGLAVDSSGNVYVADKGNNRIQKFDSNGNFITKWGSRGTRDGQFNGPSGVAIDSSGNVYVVDTNNNRIQKFNSIDGINYYFVTKWGSQGTSDGQFNNSVSVAVDSSGNVYVVDSGNHRIQKFTIDPVAAFFASPTLGKVPLIVTFKDQSIGSPTSWAWNFGDRSTSTAQNPTHTYVKAGKYTVSLTVKNAAGSNIKKMLNYITVK